MIKLGSITIDPIMLNLVAELDEFKGRWDVGQVGAG